MSVWEALAVLAAGLAAGTINAVVGSGTLITFPTLLAVGYPPVLANVSNSVGLVPGSAAAAVAYRAELAGQGGRLARLCTASTCGALVGGALLLTLPDRAFRAVVPVLIAAACVLVVLQPRLTAALAARRGARPPAHGGPALLVAVFATGVYGGYFGAAQGVLLIALLGVFLADDMQRLNAAKNVLAMTANLVAALLFIAVTEVAWEAVALLAASSVAGGLLGVRIGRRMSPVVLRGVIVAVGTAAIVRMLA